MKKTILVIVAALTTGLVSGQDLVSRKGETILPEEGDFGLGFDAAPFFNYFGRLFSDTGATSPSADFTNTNLALTPKYFVDANTAYRGTFRLGFGSTKMVDLYDTTTIAFAPPVYLEDVTRSNYTNITIGGGLEKRRGLTRVQGLYGGEVLFNIGNTKTTYTYAEALSDQNNPGLGITRPLEERSGTTFGMTLRGFAGVEFFMLPKLSFALEYGWGFGFMTTGRGTLREEQWVNTNISDPTASAQLYESTVETAPEVSSQWGFDTDNSGGRLSLMFHF